MPIFSTQVLVQSLTTASKEHRPVFYVSAQCDEPWPLKAGTIFSMDYGLEWAQ